MALNETEWLTPSQQVDLLGSSDRRVRRAAFGGLVQAGPAALDAVVGGLAHANALVRRACAEFMDHHADDRCMGPLRDAVHDPVPRVRREAVHAPGCQRCKPSPLVVDAMPLLIERALIDPNRYVRLSAVHGVGLQRPDPRAIGPLQTMLRDEPDRLVRRHAHRALRHHDPAYRAATDAVARERTPPRRSTSR